MDKTGSASSTAATSRISTETARVAVGLRGLWKTYQGSSKPAVQNLSLDVHDGEIVTLLGPSGCG